MVDSQKVVSLSPAPLYTQIKEVLSKSWPVIAEKSAPLPEAGKWAKVKDKFTQP